MALGNKKTGQERYVRAIKKKESALDQARREKQQLIWNLENEIGASLLETDFDKLSTYVPSDPEDAITYLTMCVFILNKRCRELNDKIEDLERETFSDPFYA